LLISFFSLLFIAVESGAQPMQFSIATDLALQHNFKKEQRYWSVGQNLQGQFHYTRKDGLSVLIGYYSSGTFDNRVVATAKSPTTSPQNLPYNNHSKMRLKQFSVGWKHYLKGASDNEENWNLYSCVGFGLLLGHVSNTFNVTVDTSLYNAPVLDGISNFKRLTLDLSLGWEVNLGGAIFFYNEGKILIPTTDYPSKYIFVNRDAPLVATIHFGLRILFD